MRHTIAAYLGVKNCAFILKECLSRLDWVDEIVVGDASDNDEVRRMLEEKFPKAKYYHNTEIDHRLRFEQLRQNIKSDFVLWVDSDEFYTAECAHEILEALEQPCAYDGFKIPSISHCFGECLGQGATQLRLARTSKLKWPMKSAHEMPVVDGPVKTLKNPYEHHNNPRLGIVAVKHFRYEAAEAALMETEKLEAGALDKMGPFKFWWIAALDWLRFNKRFFQTLWHYRNTRYAALCMAYSRIFHVIAARICRMEEARMRRGTIPRDTRGYL